MLKEEGKNPFSLDSKAPTTSFRDFLMDQVRYSSLLKEFPDDGDRLFKQAEIDAMERYTIYKKMSE